MLTDANFKYPAEYAPQMIEIIERNPDVGMVFGNRLGQHVDSAILRGSFYFGNKSPAFANNLFNGVDMHNPLTELRIIRPDIKLSLKSKEI